MGDEPQTNEQVIDADIAAFLASPEGKSDPEPAGGDAPPGKSALEKALETAQKNADAAGAKAKQDAEADDDEGAADAGDDGAAVDGEGSEEPPATPPSVDTAALTKAIEAKDVAAFVKALGPAAEELLSGKAHKALRLQVKELEDKTTAATTAAANAEAAQAKADELVTKLQAKYGDPIAAREACNKGDVNAFLDLVEKWAGNSWNDIQRWVAAGLAGRPARMEFKAPAAAAPSAPDPMEKARQEQAQAEVKAWSEKGVKALAPELDFPEAQELVLAEIREGFSKGINTPAKALPAVRKKLQERYERLHAVFGKGKAPPKQRVESPSARVQRSEGGKTRPATLDEEISDFLRSEGIK